jgi:hypothetical protein
VIINSHNFPGAPSGAPTATFLQATSINSSSTTYTGQNLGTASSDRYIVVALAARLGGGAIVSSVTIAGVSATIIAQTNSGSNCVTLAMAAVPSGTSGDVSFTLSSGGSLFRSLIAVFSVTGLSSATPNATATTATNNGAMSVAIPANGIAIAAAMAFASSGTGQFTWTNATERSDQLVSGTTGLSTASASSSTAATVSISANQTGTSISDFASIAASWV